MGAPISDCAIFDLSDRNCKNIVLLQNYKKGFSINSFIVLLKVANIEFEYGWTSLSSPDKIVKHIKKGLPVITYNRRSGTLGLIIGYSQLLSNPKFLYYDPSVSNSFKLTDSDKILDNDTDLYFIETFPEPKRSVIEFVYFWELNNSQSPVIKTDVCMVFNPDRDVMIYGVVKGDNCNTFAGKIAEFNPIYYLYTNQNSALYWDSPGSIPNRFPNLTTPGPVRKDSTNPISNPVCRASLNGSIFYGFYRGGLSPGLCFFYSNSTLTTSSENIEILYIVPRKDKDSLEDKKFRNYIRLEEQTLLSKLNTLTIEIGITKKGKKVEAYSASAIEAHIDSSRKQLNILFIDPKFEGLRRYIEEAFPKLEEKDKFEMQPILSNEPVSSKLSKNKRIAYTNLVSSKINSTIDSLYVSPETVNSLKNKIEIFFNNVADDKLMINLIVDGNQLNSEIIIKNARGKPISGFLKTVIPIYRGRYAITVSKAGFKEFKNPEFDLVIAEKYTLFCDLQPNGSAEPSVCRFY